MGANPPLRLVFFDRSAPDELMHGDFHVLCHKQGIGEAWQLNSATYEHGTFVTLKMQSVSADELGFRRIVEAALTDGLNEVYVPASDLAEIDYYAGNWVGKVEGDTSRLTTIVTLPKILLLS